MRSFALLIAVLSVAAPLAAQDTRDGTPTIASTTPKPHTFAWVADATFEFGGETVAEVVFTTGDRQKITAGQGGTFSFGAEYRPPTLPKLTLRGLVGWKFATSAADNVTIMFTRIPIKGVASWAIDQDWRVGAGVVRHTGINFDFDGLAPNFSFNPASGATLELGWRAVALTYTAMQYRAEDGTPFDASAIGVSLSGVFGKR